MENVLNLLSAQQPRSKSISEAVSYADLETLSQSQMFRPPLPNFTGMKSVQKNY